MFPVPQQQQQFVVQQPQQGGKVLIEEPKKARGSRKPWEVARYGVYMRALANCAHEIGRSYVRPKNPESVPQFAPDSSEWNAINHRILEMIDIYEELYEERKKINSTKKGHNGGLEQFLYVNREATEFFNNSGILGDLKLPVNVQAGGIGIATRALMTSGFVAYAENNGLKHHDEKKYIMRNQALHDLIGEATFEIFANQKPDPKVAKKKKPQKLDKNGNPVAKKKEQPRVKILDRNGQPTAHFSFDAIPALSSFFILPLTPIPLDTNEQTKEQIAKIRAHLKDLTAKRKDTRKVTAKADRERKKAQAVEERIVTGNVYTLSLNPNAPVPNQANPAGGFGGFVPQPTPVYIPGAAAAAQAQTQAQPQPSFQQNLPTGIVPQPGVNFLPQQPANAGFQ